MQTGKKKLVLDHLIVQKMDDEDSVGDDVQSILMHGAQALFSDDPEQASRDIHCEHPSAPAGLCSSLLTHRQTRRRTSRT
jgi:hypothetical protein